MKTPAIFSEVTFEEFVDLFNNISKALYYTTELTNGMISQDSWGMKLRYILENKHVVARLNIDKDEKEKLKFKDSFFYFNILSTNDKSFHLVFDTDKRFIINSHDKDTFFVRSLFSNSPNEVLFVFGNIFEDLKGENITELFLRILYTIISDSDEHGNIKQRYNIAKLFSHMIYCYEDDWIKDEVNKELLNTIIIYCNKDSGYCKLKVSEEIHELLQQCVSL